MEIEARTKSIFEPCKTFLAKDKLVPYALQKNLDSALQN
jgi:hypothetical protein